MSDELIFSYSRAQAIEDGILVDLTLLAPEVGLRAPVAMTRTAFESVCRPGAYATDAVAVLASMRLAVMARPETTASDRVDFFAPGAEGGLCNLYALCGPGDDPRPVITIMLPDED